ncbi:Mannose-P-dolichol utilization defect 1 protein [Liparis tanakae]|uniref:Mannose-P-dolichol utilization defect 1 protein n=1 Tax=Liparis tanakae TaxID=230148 RepID=A0A4Z2ETA1_9TELE|nr:Mannose-P-dolichol utilization defect 1 protein [Liparis tanakae]
MAEEAVVVEGSSFMDPFKGLLLTYFMPESCYDEFFLNFNFLDVPCLKVVLSKGLGIGIILGSVMVKLPQIFKLMGAKSAEGLSFHTVLLELLAITATMVYSIANKFPFRLAPHLKSQRLLFLVVYFGLLALLLSPATPTSVSTSLQASTMPAVIVGRVGRTSRNTFIITLIYTTVQMFWVTQTILCFTSKPHNFIYQLNCRMNIK